MGQGFFGTLKANSRCHFTLKGEWGWETRNIQSGKPSAWENPGDGFQTGCTTWNTTNSCIGFGEGPDYLFALFGRATSLSS